jgi:hypothetical protein
MDSNRLILVGFLLPRLLSKELIVISLKLF